MIPNAHFHKAWQSYVNCHFDQPMKKKSRRVARSVVRKNTMSLYSIIPRCFSLDNNLCTYIVHTNKYLYIYMYKNVN